MRSKRLRAVSPSRAFGLSQSARLLAYGCFATATVVASSNTPFFEYGLKSGLQYGLKVAPGAIGLAKVVVQAVVKSAK